MKKPITFISIISIFLFVAAIGWFGTGIFVEKSNAGQQTQAKFDTLLLKTSTAASLSRYGTPEFSKKFLEAIENIDDYSSIKLEINGQLVYSYPPAGFSLPSADLVKQYKNSVTIADGTQITLAASMLLLKSTSIYNYGRFAFMLILAGTMIALLLLMLLKEPKKQEEKPFDFDYDAAYSDDELIFETDSEEADSTENEISQETENSGPVAEEDKAESETSFFNSLESQQQPDESALHDFENELSEESINLNFEEPVPPRTEPAETSENNEVEEEETEEDYLAQIEEYKKTLADDDFENESITDEPEAIIENDFEEPEVNKALFNPEQFEETVSPITGLKVQATLNEDLSEAIKESNSSESDLTIALLKVNGLDRGNSISNDVVEILKKNINDMAEIYEYKSDSYAILLKSVDLNSCVESFDKIYQEITDFLKTNNAANEVTIGISSVNGRNVDCERLVSEADLALVHADEDPDSPIIAFRANPEKFKEFMENQ